MRRLVDSIRATAAGVVEVVFYIDNDDPDSIQAAIDLGAKHVIGERIVLSDMWNAAAAVASHDVLMMCGDDIVMRTPGWDQRVLIVFDAVDDGIALVYGNDLAQRRNLATHPFLHRRWIDAVGYFVPPGFSCDWSDAWLDEVATQLGRRIYLSDVITEHMHPVMGKSRLDQTHRDRLDRGRRDNVRALYEARADERARDVERLRAVMTGGSRS